MERVCSPDVMNSVVERKPLTSEDGISNISYEGMRLQNLQFDERGLIPTILQDRLRGRILLFSYMNKEALALTLQTGVAHLWNVRQQRILQHRDPAGKVHRVVDILADDEGAALIIKVDPPESGQRGEASRFRTSLLEPTNKPGEVSIVNIPSMEIGLMLSGLFQLIVELERERPENSYTAHLFERGLDFMLKKLGEEITEVMLAAKNEARQELGHHLADLLYHILVLMVAQDIDLRDLLAELRQRAGLPTQPLPQEHRNT
ncbi:MAG: phosphoribosyl-ATP diphosphatase [Acidobacteria bacterium]|nr:MAG: phosphoribosyl-ATP diphosphatase [Acidobacteriota bacterium]